MKKNIIITVLLCILGVSVLRAQALWPQRIYLNDGLKITIFQPQTEEMSGNVFFGRAAISVSTSSMQDPIFGVCWFKANLVELNAKIRELNSLEITYIKLSDSGQTFQKDFIAQQIVLELPKKGILFSYSELNNSLKQEQKLRNPVLNNTAPNIIYRTKPSTLVLIDGEPKYEQDSKLGIERIINTPSIIVKNPDNNLLYFYGSGLWYSSPDIISKWSFVRYIPSRIQAVDNILNNNSQNKIANEEKNIAKATSPADIIVSTSPAELIQTEGEVTYQNIDGTNLLYADNSLDDIFKDVNSQKNYILVAGRWYTSYSLVGPWDYVPSNQLPADFAKIPEGSEKDGVLSSVAGTEASKQAVTEAQVPQTAKIDRRNVTCNVTYDGEPYFTAINGTHMMVAENSSITVLKSNGIYYAVDNGVWFNSYTPNGPWKVSIKRPDEVDNIPADNIAYNTRYVYVYDYNPDFVWMGYTSGYLGSYVYGPTVVWGTGWYYRPWYHHHYFPRAYTWGFGMQYNPWDGWGIGYNAWWGFGDYYWDNSFYYGGFGWFGPRFYRPRCNSWGFNGGYFGRGAVHGFRPPNVMYNRPVNYKMNEGFQHKTAVTSREFSSHNLYHRVSGARTTDIFQQPRDNAPSAESGGLTGKPIGGLNTNHPGVNQGSNLPQQFHINRPENTPSNNTPSDSRYEPPSREFTPPQTTSSNNNVRPTKPQQSQTQQPRPSNRPAVRFNPPINNGGSGGGHFSPRSESGGSGKGNDGSGSKKGH